MFCNKNVCIITQTICYKHLILIFLNYCEYEMFTKLIFKKTTQPNQAIRYRKKDSHKNTKLD